MSNDVYALHIPKNSYEENLVSFKSFSQTKNLFYNLIQKNPRIRFNEIVRHTGLKNGVVSYHLLQLERQGNIRAIRTPRVTRFYTLDISKNSQKIIARLRQKTPNKIISVLLKKSFSFKELVQLVGKSPSNTSYYLTKLIEDEIIDDFFIRKVRHYKINSEKFDKICDLIS